MEKLEFALVLGLIVMGLMVATAHILFVKEQLTEAKGIFYDFASGETPYTSAPAMLGLNPLTWLGRDFFANSIALTPFLFFPAFFYVFFNRLDLAFFSILIPFPGFSIYNVSQLMFTMLFFLMAYLWNKKHEAKWAFFLAASVSHAYAGFFNAFYIIAKRYKMPMMAKTFMLGFIAIIPLFLVALNLALSAPFLTYPFFSETLKNTNIYGFLFSTIPLAFVYYRSPHSHRGVVIAFLLLIAGIVLALWYHANDPLQRVIYEFDMLILLFMALDGVELAKGKVLDNLPPMTIAVHGIWKIGAKLAGG